MTEHVLPRFGYMIVQGCEWPFQKPKGIIIDPMLEATLLRWMRVEVSAAKDYESGDLICIREGTIDKLFTDGGVCFGLLHESTVCACIKKQHATGVKNLISTAETENADYEKFKAAQDGLREKLMNPNRIQVLPPMPKIKLG